MTTDNPSDNSAALAAAKSGVEDLTKEFDKATVPSKQVAELIRVLQPVADFATGEARAKLETRVKDEMASTVTFLKKTDGLPDLPDRMVRGFIRDYANDFPHVAKAWDERDANPKAWEDARVEVRDALRTDAEGKKLGASSDVRAAAAAVRNQTHQQPSQPAFDAVAFMNMSDTAADEYVAKWAAGKK